MGDEMICFLLLLGVSNAQNIGNFWHITDHHLDPYYSPHADDPMDICPSSFGRTVVGAGPLGDYL